MLKQTTFLACASFFFSPKILSLFCLSAVFRELLNKLIASLVEYCVLCGKDRPVKNEKIK